MKQYPIWNIINSCIYKGAKSYGVRDHGDVEVRVGTSSRNSYTFVEHSISHRLHDDGKVIKTGILKKGADMLEIN